MVIALICFAHKFHEDFHCVLITHKNHRIYSPSFKPTLIIIIKLPNNAPFFMISVVLQKKSNFDATRKKKLIDDISRVYSRESKIMVESN